MGDPANGLSAEHFQRLLSGSRLRIRQKSAFFATLLLHTDILPSREVALAATDGERVYLNPQAAQRLSPAELDGVLLHEVLHAALSHVSRRGPREKKRWNHAADIVVNGLVNKAGLPLLQGQVLDTELEHLKVEEIYQALAHKPLPEGSGDDLLDGPPSDALPSQASAPKGTKQAQQQVKRWRQALAQARNMQAMQGHGTDPLGAHRDLPSLEGEQLDWRAQLWRFLARTPVDFGGFDRRFVGRGLYLEALDTESLHVLIAVDTSGSVDDDEVRKLLSEVQGVLGAYPHVRATLYYADTELYGPHALRAHDEIPAPQGGGGTDFRPLFETTDQHQPDLIVYLTDGYGDFPEQPPRIPTLWVVAEWGLANEEFPFGEVIRLGEEES